MTRRIILVDIGAGLTVRGVLPSVSLFAVYSAALKAGGGQAPYTYTVVAGAAEFTAAGFYLDAATGNISGTAGVAGTLAFTVRVTDLSGAHVERPYAITVIAEPLTLSGNVPDGTVGVPTTYDYIPTGGVPPRTYAVIGGPDGITVPDASAPRLSLNPIAGGIAEWTMRVTDSIGAVFDLPDSAMFTVVYAELKIVGSFGPATIGASYLSEIPITGGDGSYSNPRVTVGALPAWATLSIVSGKLRLSGTPTGSATTANFTVAVDSGDGQTATSAQSVVVTIVFAPVAFDPGYCHSDVALSNGNYTASKGTAGYRSVYGAVSKLAGKWQVEARVSAVGGTIGLGLADKYYKGTGGDARGLLSSYLGDNNEVKASIGLWSIGGSLFLFRNDGGTRINSQSVGSVATGDYLAVCYDIAAGLVAFYKNGNLIAGTSVSLLESADPAGYFPGVSLAGGGSMTLTNGSLVHPIDGYAQWG